MGNIPINKTLNDPTGSRWDGLPMPARLWAIIAIAFGVGLSVLDATITNVALPTIALSLGVEEAQSIWVVNSYQLATVMTMLSFSAIGNRIGYRRVYTFGLSLFTLASVVCALAPTLGWLLVGRVIQGIGAGAVTSINTTLIRIIYPKLHLGRGMGLNATIVAIASVAGPTIASAILSLGDWPWLFAINLPIGLVAVGLSWRFLPENPARSLERGFDWRSGLLNALFFGLLFSTAEAFINDTSIGGRLALATALLLVGWSYIGRQLRQAHPMLPFDLLRIPIFSMSVATSICSYLAQMSAMVALPFYLQYRLGYSDVETGLLMTAWPFVIMFAAPVAGRLVERVHAGLLGGVGLLVMATGALLTATLPAEASSTDILWRLALTGIGFAGFQSPNNSILVASAPQARSGSASGMQGTARLIGQTGGATLVAALFRHFGTLDGALYALYASALLALIGSVVSLSRLKEPLPEALRKQ